MAQPLRPAARQEAEADPAAARSTSCCRGCGSPGVAPAENPGRRRSTARRSSPTGGRSGSRSASAAASTWCAQAAAHPEVGLIGCEPFVNGVAMALGRIEAAGLGNVRLHPGDARDLIELLPDGVARRGSSCSTPTPGRRRATTGGASRARRTSALLARAMAPGAELRLATDIADYAEHALEAVAAAPGFAVRRRRPARPWAGLAGDPLRGQGARGGPAAAVPDLPRGA